MKAPLALILVLTIIGSSCKKEVKPNEGTVLKKIESKNDDGSTGYRAYERNPGDKIISFRDWNSTSGVGMAVIYEYAGNGKVLKAHTFDNSGNELYYFEFEYYPDGKLWKRFTKPGTINLADDINVYTYDVAGHLAVDSQYSRNDQTKPYVPLAVARFTYTGDNATEAEHWRSPAGTMILEQRMKYEYDNGINPFKNSDNYYSINEANSAIYDIRYMSANNVVKEHSATGNGPFELHQTFSYQYNSSKYPWKLKQEFVDGSNSMESEFFYEK